MAEILPDALAGFDQKKQAIVAQLANLLASPKDALAQIFGQSQDTVNSRNQDVTAALANKDYAGVVNSANQGVAPVPGLAEARAQLAHYQLPIFEKVYAATLDPVEALKRTKEMTNLMGGTSGGVVDLTKSMLNAGLGS